MKEHKKVQPVENNSRQYDFGDLTRSILKPNKKSDSSHNKSGITVVPNIAADPTIGLQGGIKAVAGKKLGNDPKTLFPNKRSSTSIRWNSLLIRTWSGYEIFCPGMPDRAALF